jgi:hypothetical protein
VKEAGLLAGHLRGLSSAFHTLGVVQPGTRDTVLKQVGFELIEHTRSAIVIDSSFEHPIRCSSRCGTIPKSFLNTRYSLLHLSDKTGQMQLAGVTYGLKERTYSFAELDLLRSIGVSVGAGHTCVCGMADSLAGHRSHVKLGPALLHASIGGRPASDILNKFLRLVSAEVEPH